MKATWPSCWPCFEMRLPCVRRRDADVADQHCATEPPPERTSPPCKLAINPATGFLVNFRAGRRVLPGRQKTARFLCGLRSATPSRSSSHVFCVGTIDCAFVSKSVRSFSNNVRRRHPIVSANLRRKVPLIARRAGYHCAPLELPRHPSGTGPNFHPRWCGLDLRRHYRGHRFVPRPHRGGFGGGRRPQHGAATCGV